MRGIYRALTRKPRQDIVIVKRKEGENRHMNILLMILIGVGYIFLLIGYGQKGIEARKAQGKSGWDGCVCIMLTVAVIFWAVKLVLWLMAGRPDNGDKWLIIGMAAVYVLWCVYARISVKRYSREKRAGVPANTHSSGEKNNQFDNKFDLGEKGPVTTGTSVNFASAGSGPSGDAVPLIPKAKQQPEDVPLTGDMGLGSHHVSAGHAHIGMTVSYRFATHTVEYCHWSDQDPEKTEVYQIPPHIRTRNALIAYLCHDTPIPSVCFMPY